MTPVAWKLVSVSGSVPPQAVRTTARETAVSEVRNFMVWRSELVCNELIVVGKFPHPNFYFDELTEILNKCKKLVRRSAILNDDLWKYFHA
jgi:hypothetical protein